MSNPLLPAPLDGFEVHLVTSLQARKDYTCPDCGNVVTIGEPHVVAWPEGDRDRRRHWHRHCWRIVVASGERF